MTLPELQGLIRRALHHGDSLEEVQAEIIDPAPFGEEKKAAVRRYAAAIAETQRSHASDVEQAS
jgi:hypothetical protein